MTLPEYSDVRVVRLMQAPACYDPWRVNLRPPCPGDVGTIVDVRRSLGQPDRYVVENSGGDGSTIWLAEFSPEELEPIVPIVSSVAHDLHIIITRADVVLSRFQYHDWRAIQATVPGYMASLGPWPPDQVIEYLQFEWPDLEPSASSQVQSFLSSGASEVRLSFRAPSRSS